MAHMANFVQAMRTVLGARFPGEHVTIRVYGDAQKEDTLLGLVNFDWHLPSFEHVFVEPYAALDEGLHNPFKVLTESPKRYVWRMSLSVAVMYSDQWVTQQLKPSHVDMTLQAKIEAIIGKR